MNQHFIEGLTQLNPPTMEAFGQWLIYGFCVAGLGYAAYFAYELATVKRT